MYAVPISRHIARPKLMAAKNNNSLCVQRVLLIIIHESKLSSIAINRLSFPLLPASYLRLMVFHWGPTIFPNISKTGYISASP